MRGAVLLVLVAICLTALVDASPKSYVRYINSMPQFGKAKFSAFSPQTVLFDQVPQGYVTSYSSIAAQLWNFTSQYTTNVTATSDETDVNSGSYLTVFTCQKSQRKLKNGVIYDIARSPSPTAALLRTVNLAQYNYDIDVYNGSNPLFNNVPYCVSSSYIQVPPGQYDFQWTVSGAKKRAIEGCPPNCSGPATLSSGSAYTLYVSPTGSTVVQDASTAKRSVQDELGSEVAAPVTEEQAEEVDVNEVNVTKQKKIKQIRRKKIGRKMKRSFAQRV